MLTVLLMAPIAAVAPAALPQGLTGFCPSGPQCARLAPYNSGAFDHFGSAVAISGETAAVGAIRSAVGGGAAGVAFVFQRDGVGPGGWTETARLVPDTAVDDADFGTAIAIDGDTIVVGALSDDELGTASGSAFVFERDAFGFWSQTAKLAASDGGPFHRFGRSVSISGDWILVGADKNNTGGSLGAAYSFTRSGDNWVETNRITPIDATADFGFSVSIDGTWAAIGAWGDDDAGNNAGAVYVFRRSESIFGTMWLQEQKLTADDASDGAANAWFGAAVDVDGSDLVVGAYGYNSSAGIAYVYRAVPEVPPFAPTWTYCDILLPCVSTAGDQFGRSVSIDEKIVVGAPLDDEGGTSSGSAFVFRRFTGGSGCNLFERECRLTAKAGDAGAGDQYGSAVAIDGASDTVIVGAEWDDNAGQDSGSAFVHTCGGTCDTQVICGYQPYGANVTPVNDLRLHGTGGDAVGKVGTIVVSGAGAANPALVYNALYLGSGAVSLFEGLVLVDVATKVNTPLDTPAGVVGGSAEWQLAIPSLPALAGVAVFMQALIFDANQPAGIALSNGLRLVICA